MFSSEAINECEYSQSLIWFIFSPRQHDNDWIDDRSQIQGHTDERTQVHGARSSLVVTHPSTNGMRESMGNGTTLLHSVYSAIDNVTKSPSPSPSHGY